MARGGRSIIVLLGFGAFAVWAGSRGGGLIAMPAPDYHVPVYVDYLATFSWALSGALVGMRQRYDVLGMLLVAMFSATGGSILRDGLFLNETPPVLTNFWYLPIILTATLGVVVSRRWIVRSPLVESVVNYIDAIGTPAFAIVGMQLALQANIPIPGVIVIGFVNGAGGGLLRDVTVQRVPKVFVPGHYIGSALLVVCGVFLLMTITLELSVFVATWSTIALYFALRAIGLHFNLQTRPVLHEM